LFVILDLIRDPVHVGLEPCDPAIYEQ